ncbi:unnamed protein product, partial [Ceratitis capitata]
MLLSVASGSSTLARPQEITITTHVSATATASVHYSDNVRTFTNVATSTAVQNTIFHIL